MRAENRSNLEQICVKLNLVLNEAHIYGECWYKIPPSSGLGEKNYRPVFRPGNNPSDHRGIGISLNRKSLVDAKIPRSRQVLTLAAQSKESVTKIEPLYAVDSTVLFMRISVLLERSGESVIDGGGLLYAVTWQPFSTLKQVIYQYYSYVTSNYGISSTVVFDGYIDGPSVKDHEHNRRIMASGAHIQIEHHATVLSNQHGFLANDENKSKLINQLTN
ncbi:hypothetical protein GQR58_015425 [Nymphon striatum]|nr:hypothetical protein GQR58_015425 [Nymphon striatum]